VNVGTEESRKGSPSFAAHETTEPRAARKDLPQTLARLVPQKRTLCTDFFVCCWLVASSALL